MSELPTRDTSAGGSSGSGASGSGSSDGASGGGTQSSSRRRRSRSRGGRGGSARGGGATSSAGEGRSTASEATGTRAAGARAGGSARGTNRRGTGGKDPDGGPRARAGGGSAASKNAKNAKNTGNGRSSAQREKAPRSGGDVKAQAAGRTPTDAGGARRGSGAPSEAQAGGGGDAGGRESLPGTRAYEAADRENAARVAANRRRVRELSGLTAAMPALVAGIVVGIVVSALIGAVVAVVVAALVAVVVPRQALGRALRVIGGRRVGPAELPALANQVDGLCATIGVARPELWVLEDPLPNACALDGPGSPGVLLVTTGLVDGLDRIEMEGVLAHELVHLKRCDAVVSAVAVATVGALCAATGRDGLLHRTLGMGREYEADQAAALAVRYPPGLERALRAMGSHGHGAVGAAGPATTRRGVFDGRRWAATRWIWIDPVAVGTSETVEGDLDVTGVRRDALAQW